MGQDISEVVADSTSFDDHWTFERRFTPPVAMIDDCAVREAGHQFTIVERKVQLSEDAGPLDYFLSTLLRNYVPDGSRVQETYRCEYCKNGSEVKERIAGRN